MSQLKGFFDTLIHNMNEFYQKRGNFSFQNHFLRQKLFNKQYAQFLFALTQAVLQDIKRSFEKDNLGAKMYGISSEIIWNSTAI